MLELAVPVWQPALTQQESKQIERVKKVAFHVILGPKYENYENALEITGHDMLSNRRIQLCKTFAKKCLNNPKFSNWFCPVESLPITKTRGAKKETRNQLNPVQTRTERYAKSPIPYLTGLLNKP